MYDEIIGYKDLVLLNRRIANEKLSFRINDMGVDVTWMNFSMHHQGEKEEKQEKGKIHRHSFFETFLCLRGSTTYLVYGEEYQVRAGQVLLFNRECEHCYGASSGDMCKISLGFNFSSRETKLAAKLIAAFSRNDALVVDVPQETIVLFYSILKEMDQRPLFYRETVQNLIFAIILGYARLISDSADDHDENGSSYTDSRIGEIDSYIREHMAEMVTVADIAQHINISTKQINRILQVNFNQSGRSYVDRMKCEYAKKLLLHTDMTLEKIADEIGYATVFSFNKFFRRVEGMPPGLFRKSHYAD